MQHKFYSFINIVGLSFGMTCFILIFLWVVDEINFDKHFKNYDNLYQVYEYQHYAGGDYLYTNATPAALAAELREKFPELKKACHFQNVWSELVFKYDNKLFNENNALVADSLFLEMFTIPLIKGDSKTALNDLNSIVISEKMANKYFGNDEALGKVIRVNNMYELTVTGVMKDIPKNSTFWFNCIIPFNWVKDFWHTDITQWGNNSYNTFIQLDSKVNTGDLAKKIFNVINDHFKGSTSKTDVHLRSLSKVHLYALDPRGMSSIVGVELVGFIALFVLIIACINFMNLATARSANRAKEVGLRKVVGAQRRQLISQFLGESVLLSFISLIFAVIMVELLLPVFNQLTDKSIVFEYTNLTFILTLIAIAFVTGLISGSYPSLFLSAFNPVLVLKGKLKTGSKGSMFRRVLVIVQFSLSIMLVICTIMVTKQVDYIQNRKLGYDKNNLITVAMQGDINKKYQLIKQEFSNIPGVSKVSGNGGGMPVSIGNSTSSVSWPGRDTTENILWSFCNVDDNLFDTYGMKLIDGRTFQKENLTDTANIVLNEEAAKMMNKKEVVGEPITIWGVKGTVIGVVSNFHFEHLSQKIGPLFFYYNPKSFGTLAIKIESPNLSATIKDIQAKWKTMFPEFPFEYRFVDDYFNNMYRAEQRMQKIFIYFSILAILISCLGLFGLASFMAEQQSKSMVIRKIHGASVNGIIMLMSKEFARWVIIACVIAFPLSYWIIRIIYQNYAYRAEVSAWLFIAAGIGALAIALATVSYQSYKTARQNPADVLKYE